MLIFHHYDWLLYLIDFPETNDHVLAVLSCVASIKVHTVPTKHKLIKSDSTILPIAIPYDFDHAGIVNAPYANPAQELGLKSILERRYRGYCIPEIDQYKTAIDTFNQLKEDFYAYYDGNPLLSDQYQKQTLKFLDQFYETINNPKEVLKEFSYPCDKSGTGNVIIKGLKKNE